MVPDGRAPVVVAFHPWWCQPLALGSRPRSSGAAGSTAANMKTMDRVRMTTLRNMLKVVQRETEALCE